MSNVFKKKYNIYLVCLQRYLLDYNRDRMGFLHQLWLLLWKNFTLKKRSPVCTSVYIHF